MSWNDLTLNPKVVLGYFDEAPSLEEIEIHRLSLSRDASSLEVVFEPAVFPEHPSQKWPKDSNTVQITLRLIDVSEMALNGWGCNVFGRLSISQEGHLLALTFDGQVKFKAICSHIDVASISGYCTAQA